jgi:hypothetical protein
VDLGWTDNSDTETEFRIEQQARGTGTWEQIGLVQTDVVTFSDTGLNSVYSNRYRVRACTPTACSDYASLASIPVQQGPSGAPSAPTGLTAIAVSTSRINLTWQDNSQDEVGFLLFRFWGGSGTWEQIGLLGPNQTSHSDTGLVSGTTHYYLVLACSSTACSDISNLANAKTLGPTPPVSPPTGLSATAVSSTQINLSWTDNSQNEFTFLVYRSPNGVTDWSILTSVGANITNYPDTNLSEGTWHYVLAACTLDTCSAFSDPANATISGAVPPNAPSNLQATGVSSSQIDLTWTDNSPDDLGFLMSRSPNGTTSWEPIAVLGLDATSYSDTGVSGGLRYFYRVQACRQNTCSYPSNVADAMTAPASGTISVNLGPDPTTTVTPGLAFYVPVLVDMTEAGGIDLASMTVEITWDPTKLTFDSHLPGTFGTGSADESRVASGTFRYSVSSPTGTQDSFTGFSVTLLPAAFQGDAVITGRVTEARTGSGANIKNQIAERDLTAAQNPGAGGFEIDLDYATGVLPAYRSAFEAAAARWEEIIVGDVPDHVGFLPSSACQPQGEAGPVDDLKIFVSVETLDGPGGALGQAHPCYYRTSGAQLPITARILIDAADISGLLSAGILDDILLHEMGHSLGMGLLWHRPPYAHLQDAGTSDPYFSGPAAIAAFNALGGSGRVGPKVPVENTGGFGVQDVHWRASVFGFEVMSVSLDQSGGNPISSITVASLADLGYTVDPGAADPYTVPSPHAAAAGEGSSTGFRLIEAPGPKPLPAPNGG